MYQPRSGPRPHHKPRILTDSVDELMIECDVLVVGGGPAATWAAVSALESAPVSVVLVDKGYCGASGVAATSGVGHWLSKPESRERIEMIHYKSTAGGDLSDIPWIHAVLDEAWTQIHKLPDWGWEKVQKNAATKSLHLAPSDEMEDSTDRSFFRGPAPDYLRFMRGQVRRRGGLILDHSPALELLQEDHRGAISGARGYQRQKDRPWKVGAKAVILATGGTTWKSHSQGGDVNTGDGQLMAAEAGAHFSSMEFSNFQGMVPLGTSMDKNGYFVQASYWDEHGNPIEYADLHESRLPLLRHSKRGTIYAQFNQFSPEQHDTLRHNMPNFFAVADKLGIDPFNQKFPMDWVHEGTVRGTGGVSLTDSTCRAGIDGLYAVGDVAARDRITGASTGAGGPNLSWAVASGTWSGRHAAHYADSTASSTGTDIGLGTIALKQLSPGKQPEQQDPSLTVQALTRRIQEQMLPLEKSVFRTEESLLEISEQLELIWEDLNSVVLQNSREEAAYREVAGMAAMARWATASALHRKESRGMHHRMDFPERSEEFNHKTLSGGLSQVWVSTDVKTEHRDPSLVYIKLKKKAQL